MYGALGTTTGVSTPHSASSLRPLVLNHGPLEYTLLIPTTLHYHATELHQRFTSQLPLPPDEFALDEEPSSITELLSRFLAFVTQKVTEGERAMHREPTRRFYGLS